MVETLKWFMVEKELNYYDLKLLTCKIWMNLLKTHVDGLVTMYDLAFKVLVAKGVWGEGLWLDDTINKQLMIGVAKEKVEHTKWHGANNLNAEREVCCWWAHRSETELVGHFRGVHEHGLEYLTGPILNYHYICLKWCFHCVCHPHFIWKRGITHISMTNS